VNFEEINNLEFEDVGNRPSASWLVSLSDLICLVLTFFVMMYSTKDIGEDKISEIRDSFVSYLGGQEMNYIENGSDEIEGRKIIKRSEEIANIENLLITILKDYKDIGIYYAIKPNELIIWVEEDKLPKNLSKTFNERLFVVAQLINSANNQVEISAQGLDGKSFDTIMDFVLKKFKELGYNNNMLITLPQKKIITENLEKDKNKIKIQVIIKDYESVF
jgi:flagellar motor protein MotB